MHEIPTFDFKMAANPPRAVFWQNRKEWLDVYSWLYNFNSINQQRRGVNRVAAWRSRSSGKLPVGIEATVNLVTAQIDDVERFVVAPQETHMCLAMSLVRFVNSMVDKRQKKAYARSVHSIATELGFPEWLVELRHEATHGALPGHDTLRTGVDFALSWLRQEYWESQIKEFSENAEKLWEGIQDFKAKQELIIEVKCQKKRNKMKLQRGKKLDEVLNMIYPESFSDCLFPLLLQDGCLVSEQDNILASNNNMENNPGLPSKITRLWRPFFKAVQSKYPVFIPLFTNYLLECFHRSSTQERDVDTRYQKIACWLDFFLKQCVIVDQCHLEVASFSWLAILKECFHFMNKTTGAFVPFILANVESISVKKKRKLKCLAHLAVDLDIQKNKTEMSFTDKKCSHKNRVSETSLAVEYSRLSEVSQRLQNETAESDNEENTPGSWECATDVSDWALHPMGIVFGSSEPSSSALEFFENDISTQSLTPLVDACYTDNENSIISEHSNQADLPVYNTSENIISLDYCSDSTMEDESDSECKEVAMEIEKFSNESGYTSEHENERVLDNIIVFF